MVKTEYIMAAGKSLLHMPPSIGWRCTSPSPVKNRRGFFKLYQQNFY